MLAFPRYFLLVSTLTSSCTDAALFCSLAGLFGGEFDLVDLLDAARAQLHRHADDTAR